MIIDLEAELKVRVTTSAAAQARAAKALGCKKVVVAQPYELSETDRIASYGTHFGCEGLGATGWGSAFNQIGRIPRHAALDMGRKLMREHPDADSILLPSPHWPTAEAIDALEGEFGINVMAAHQAIVWDALRRCGINDRVAGFGRLFREFWVLRGWRSVTKKSQREARCQRKPTPAASGAGPCRLSLSSAGGRRRRRSRSRSRPASPIPSIPCWRGTWPAMPVSTPRRDSRSTSST